MKKVVIIFYEHIDREYEACLRLKKELLKNYEVHLFSIFLEYSKALKINKNKKIDMVIMPWIYFDGDYRYTQPFLEKNEDVFIVNFHHEQIGSEFAEKFMLPSEDQSKNSVLHFVWGDFFASKLESIGINKNFIFKTGNIRTDNGVEKSLEKEQLAKEYNLDVNKKWILFCENRTWIYTDNDGKKQHRIKMGFIERDMNERAELLKKSLELTLIEFNSLDDTFFENYEFIYRTHPGSIAPININSRINVIDKYSVYTWLDAVDVNVVWGSTTLFESDMKGIPSFVYEPITHTKKFKPYGFENYQTIAKFEEINDKLCSEYFSDIKQKKIYENYMGVVDGKSIKLMSGIINEILINGVPEYKATLIEYSKEAVKRIKRREIYSRIVVALNLLEILKWPYRTYELKNDIPYQKGRLDYINKIVNIDELVEG